MAQVTLQYQMNDVECITANLSLYAEHPDALDELCTRATKMLKESLADILIIHRSMDVLGDETTEDGDDTPEVTV